MSWGGWLGRSFRDRAVRALGPVEVRVSRSQVAFRRRRGFAYVWRPGRYVRSAVPAVLSVVLPARDPGKLYLL